ncbi:adenosylmethionine decarboxylase [Candidatus Dependentiae bacterium]|nr:adenosylmethionine decarboxylase [Candidatus Dependentiae bacterium]
MALGIEILCDFYNCNKEKMSDKNEIEKIIIKAVEESGATIIETKLFLFSPYGLTGLIIITESHFSIHTWPEHGYIAIDYFTCNEKLDLSKTIEILKNYFEPENIDIKKISRGEIQPR